jgi:hypothetical protein
MRALGFWYLETHTLGFGVSWFALLAVDSFELGLTFGEGVWTFWNEMKCYLHVPSIPRGFGPCSFFSISPQREQMALKTLTLYIDCKSHFPSQRASALFIKGIYELQLPCALHVQQ